MVAIETCWTPFIWNNNVKSGSRCCAVYTIVSFLYHCFLFSYKFKIIVTKVTLLPFC